MEKGWNLVSGDGRIRSAKHIYREYYWVKVGNVFAYIKWVNYCFMWYFFLSLVGGYL